MRHLHHLLCLTLLACTLAGAAAASAADAAPARTPAGPASTAVEVTGAVQRTARLDLAALQALPVVEQQASGKRFRGVRLWDVLGPALAPAAGTPEARGEAVRRYLVASGADGYRAVFSLAELDPAFGNAPVLIAFEADGAPLGEFGFARLVVPGDAKPGRWVYRLARLEVFVLP